LLKSPISYEAKLKQITDIEKFRVLYENSEGVDISNVRIKSLKEKSLANAPDKKMVFWEGKRAGMGGKDTSNDHRTSTLFPVFLNPHSNPHHVLFFPVAPICPGLHQVPFN